MKIIHSIFIVVLLAYSCNRKASTVRILDLSQQNLSKVPDSVFEIRNLTHLYLGNGFTLYPPLSALVVGKNANKIRVLPAEISNLEHLRVLDVSANELISLPEEISQLKALDSLYICFNNKLQLSKELPKLAKMKGLGLQWKFWQVCNSRFCNIQHKNWTN